MSTAKFSPLLDEENSSFSTPFRQIHGGDTSSSSFVEPMEIGDVKSLEVASPPVDRRRRLVKMVVGLFAVAASLSISYHMGESRGVDEALDDIEDEIGKLAASLGEGTRDYDQSGGYDENDNYYSMEEDVDFPSDFGNDDDDDTNFEVIDFPEDDAVQDEDFGIDDASPKTILEAEIDYYNTHPDQNRPFSYLLLKHDDYSILFDDAFRDQDFGSEMQDFAFYYEHKKDPDISVSLMWFSELEESYDDIYASRMHYAEDKITNISLVSGRFVGLALLRDIKAEYSTTNILFREGRSTWEFTCDVLKADACIELAKTSLVRVSESAFVDAIEELGY